MHDENNNDCELCAGVPNTTICTCPASATKQTPSSTEGWEKYFDQRYICGAFGIDYIGKHIPFAALKEFIRSLLAQAREEEYERGHRDGSLYPRSKTVARARNEARLTALQEALGVVEEKRSELNDGWEDPRRLGGHSALTAIHASISRLIEEAKK